MDTKQRLQRKATAKSSSPLPKALVKPRVKSMTLPRMSPQIGAPTAIAQKQTSREPRIIQRNKRMTTIAHRELIQTVNGSIAFTALKFPLNPGIALTFPWLSTQAQLWELYHFRKLKFEYITRTASTTVGSVLLMPDYDPEDAPPTTEAIASAHEDTVEDVCWRSLTCPLDPLAMNPFGGVAARRYVRAFAQAGDVATFDSGNFYFCSVEQVGAAAIGKLWVEYEVDLFKPQLGNTAVAPLRTSAFSATGETFVTTVAKNYIPPVQIADPLGVATVGTPLVDGNFTPPKGSYRIFFQGNFNDNGNEAFSVQVRLFENGGALGNNVISTGQVAATAGGENLSLCVIATVNCSGSDTVQLSIIATGAAGALSLVTSSMLWELA